MLPIFSKGANKNNTIFLSHGTTLIVWWHSRMNLFTNLIGWCHSIPCFQVVLILSRNSNKRLIRFGYVMTSLSTDEANPE